MRVCRLKMQPLISGHAPDVLTLLKEDCCQEGFSHCTLFNEIEKEVRAALAKNVK